MSWDVHIVDATSGQTLELSEPHHLAGGTYLVTDGADWPEDAGNPPPPSTKRAWLNVTYNYSRHYRELWGDASLNHIHDMTVEQCLPEVQQAADRLGTETDPDYWAGTAGNAGKALADLYILLQLCPPDGVVQVR